MSQLPNCEHCLQKSVVCMNNIILLQSDTLISKKTERKTQAKEALLTNSHLFMASSNEHQQLSVFFFPFLALGHILPATNLACLFSERNIKTTIITTQANATLIYPILSQNPSINLVLLPFPSTAETDLPIGCENTASLPHPHSLHIFNLFKAVDLLKEPFTNLLQQHRPDFLISDWVYTWTTDLAQSLGIPRIVLQTCSSFTNAMCDLIHKHKPHLNIQNSIPFQVPSSRFIPHRIEMTRDELPIAFSHPFALEMFRDAEMKSYGTVMNSFYELEPCYVEFLRHTKKLWCVGPVDLGDNDNNYNQHVERIMKWLDCKDPATVIYLCFGSECIFTADQINETAKGLEAAGHPFLWVLTEDMVLLNEFEERMKVEDLGFIVRGWAPQKMILNHPAVGGFMTHCGWNSILEGVSAGLPMTAWPLHSEQFINEKLVVEVLGIGEKVLKAAGAYVDEETVRKSVESLMGGGKESFERRKRAKEYQAKARRAVQPGGSSYEDLSCLIEEMEENARKRRTGDMKEVKGFNSKTLPE